MISLSPDHPEEIARLAGPPVLSVWMLTGPSQYQAVAPEQAVLLSYTDGAGRRSDGVLRAQLRQGVQGARIVYIV